MAWLGDCSLHAVAPSVAVCGICVLTKLDIMDRGTNALAALRNLMV
jgi:hypothetical protein